MDINNQNNVLRGYNMLLYFTGSMIMFEPNEECIADFWTKGIVKNLPVSSSNPTFMKAASQLRNSCLDVNFSGAAMHEDYLRLFSRNGLALASAHESEYSQHKTPGKHNSDTVSDFYRDYGWESKFKDKISDDNLGVELLFLTLLIDKYIELDDKACRKEMKNEIRRFLNKHIMSWIPEWNMDVQNHSKTLSFKGVGSLIVACCEDILSLVSSDNEEPSGKDFKN